MRKVQVHKIEILVIDFDGLGADGVRDVLVNTRFANDCINPQVMTVESRDVEWSDNHPLNKPATFNKAYKDLFGGN